MSSRSPTEQVDVDQERAAGEYVGGRSVLAANRSLRRALLRADRSDRTDRSNGYGTGKRASGNRQGSAADILAKHNRRGPGVSLRKRANLGGCARIGVLLRNYLSLDFEIAHGC